MGGRFGEILLILIVVLLIFGPNKLPDMARAMGEALKEFKKAANPDSDKTVQSTPTQNQASVPSGESKAPEKKESSIIS